MTFLACFHFLWPCGFKIWCLRIRVCECANFFSVYIYVVREAKTEGGRGGGRGGGGGRGYGRGRGGYNRDFNNNESSFGNSGAPTVQGAAEDGDTAKTFESRGYGGPRGGGFRGGRRGGFGNEEVGEGERPRRTNERWSGTGRGWVIFYDSLYLFVIFLSFIICHVFMNLS